MINDFYVVFDPLAAVIQNRENSSGKVTVCKRLAAFLEGVNSMKNSDNQSTNMKRLN